MWKQVWDSHGGRLLGVAAGLFFGLLYLIVGFWDMLVVAFIVFIAYLIGKSKDLRDTEGSMFAWRQWYEWLNDRWKMFR